MTHLLFVVCGALLPAANMIMTTATATGAAAAAAAGSITASHGGRRHEEEISCPGRLLYNNICRKSHQFAHLCRRATNHPPRFCAVVNCQLHLLTMLLADVATCCCCGWRLLAGGCWLAAAAAVW
jgi:hypothetical protein